MIEFTTLGGIDLRSGDGQRIRTLLGQPKKIAILAYIAGSSRGSSRERSMLQAMFWPEQDDGHARHSLNQTLHVLRTGLGGQGIESIGRAQVAIEQDVILCDVFAFYRAMRSGDLETAERCYRGGFLPGFVVARLPEFERWLDRKRNRLGRDAAQIVWKLALSRERAGDMETAISYARRLLDLTPYDEGALQRVVELLGRAGDQASAREVCDAFARAMRADLDVEPSPSTLRLMQSLEVRSIRPAARARSSATVTALSAERVRASGRSPLARRSVRTRVVGALVTLAAAGMLILLGGSPSLRNPWRALGKELGDERRATADRFYKKGRTEWNERTPEGLRAALSDFTEAVRQDSTLAEGYSGIADTYAMLAWYGLSPSAEELQRARRSAERAVALDPNSAAAHASLGNVEQLVGHDLRAQAEYRRAIELDGSYVAARDWLAFDLAAHGEVQEAVTQLSEARSVAPQSAVVGTDLATMLFWSRDYTHALAELQRVATIDPSYEPMHHLLWRVNEALGRRKEAIDALQRITRDEGDGEKGVHAMERAYATGNWSSVLQQRLSILERPLPNRRLRSIEAATLAAKLGRPRSAVAWLMKARDEGNVALRFARLDPALDSVRGDPRVKAILKE